MMQAVLNLKNNAPLPRYFVPDLSPWDRNSLASLRPRVVFVAESPHVSEIAPLSMDQRRPLCGVAGRQWWSLLKEILEGNSEASVERDDLIAFCRKHKIAVMNAVQFPLDPKVAREFPEADPAMNLGFNKVSGSYSFKKLKKAPPVQSALESLKQRLSHPSVKNAPIYSLGNDADWFIRLALGKEESEKRLKDKIPHPSAWWRRGGLFGEIAKEKLIRLFTF